VTLTRVSALLAVVAAALIIAGVGMLAGVAWAFITAGACALVGAVMLYDPADKPGG
jgi:hypothetical protein